MKELMQGKFELIEVSKLYPHPDNPRKDVGDVTELAESIKACGIMQNLTVVSKDNDTYTVIIGHRRLAASKVAGLEKVPCVVADMSEKEQISTMLLENMQRSDLTIYEQAQGFQMMMDFGESVESISEKTGFSQSTVRRRVKLLDLDKDKFYAAEQRGGTIEDYLKVAEIKNEKERDKVTDAIGTNNFNSMLKDALENQTIKECLPKVKKAMKSIGVVEDKAVRSWSDGYKEILRVELDKFKPECLTGKIKEGKTYCWNMVWGTRVDVFEKLPKEKKKPVQKTKKEIKVIETNKQLQMVSKKADELRKEFLNNFNAGKKYADVINEFLREAIFRNLEGKPRSTNWDLLCEKIGEKKESYKYSCNRENLDQYVKNSPENALAVILGSYICNSKDSNYYYPGYGESMPSHKENESLDFLYKYLCELGYEMSDEEKALQNGTHELLKGTVKK